MMRHFSLKNPLVSGTIILTLTGFASRFIGFFYRIFLSRTFGAEGMGIYQLTAPVLALTFALTAAGIQTAISKFVAGETSTRDYRYSFVYLFSGLALSLTLSILCAGFVYCFSEQIAVQFLMEARTAPLLRIIALSIPMAAVHSCINGHFYGIKKTGIPSACQLSEQIVRVSSVYVIYALCLRKGYTPTISFAVVGLVIGECASMLVSLIAAWAHFSGKLNAQPAASTASVRLRCAFSDMLRLSVPLSANRVIINFLMSVEAVFIPEQLLKYGYEHQTALSIYGVLTGMSLPLILFPSAITGSVCVLLLPVVSEADAAGNQHTVEKAIHKSVKYGFLLGSAFALIFFLGGPFLGNLLYQNETAGRFISILGFLCPLMYIASTLSSILNGLGKTGLTFLYSMISLLVRLFFVFFLIPVIGINGYLLGLLVSQLVQTLLCLYAVRGYGSASEIHGSSPGFH